MAFGSDSSSGNTSHLMDAGQAVAQSYTCAHRPSPWSFWRTITPNGPWGAIRGRCCPTQRTKPSAVDHCNTTVLADGLGEGDGIGGRSVGGCQLIVRESAGPVPPTVVIV